MSWPELLGRNPRTNIRIYEAVIAEDAPDTGTMVKVTVPAYDQHLDWGPCPWPTRVDDSGDVLLPSQGDRCVVGLAETPEPGTPEVWILGWWIT